MQIQKTGFPKAASRPVTPALKADISSPEYYQDGYSEGARWSDAETGRGFITKYAAKT